MNFTWQFLSLSSLHSVMSTQSPEYQSENRFSLQKHQLVLHIIVILILFYTLFLQSTVFHPSLDWVENFPLPTWRPYIFPDKLLIKSVRFYKAKFYWVFAFFKLSCKAGRFSRKIMQKIKTGLQFISVNFEVFNYVCGLNFSQDFLVAGRGPF